MTIAGLWSPVAQAGLPLEQIELATDSEAWQSWVAEVAARGELPPGADGPIVSLLFETIDCEPRGEAWSCRFGDLPGPEEGGARRWVVGHDEPWVEGLRFWRDLDPSWSAPGSGFVVSRVEVFCRHEPWNCRFLVPPSERRPTSARLSGDDLSRRLATWVIEGSSEQAATTDVLPWVSADAGCSRPGVGEPWSCRWSAVDARTLELVLDPDDPEQAKLLLVLRRFATERKKAQGAVVEFETADLRVECQHRAVAGDGFCQIQPGAGPGGED